MPINESLMKALAKKYGISKAKEIYYSMESDNKASFKKGLKTAKKEGHLVNKFTNKR